MLRNFLPCPLPMGMSVATCPARARRDMLAEPGWAGQPPLLAPEELWRPVRARAAAIPRHAWISALVGQAGGMQMGDFSPEAASTWPSASVLGPLGTVQWG